MIIGAGASGLAAAVDLKDKADVVIVEARNRVGGRVWTEKFSDGAWIDLGAAFVEGPGPKNPVMQEFKKHGIKTTPLFYDQAAAGNVLMWGLTGAKGEQGQAKKLGMCGLLRAGWAYSKLMALYEEDKLARNRQFGALEGPDEDLWTGLRKLKSGGCFGFGGIDSLDATTYAMVKCLVMTFSEFVLLQSIHTLSYRWFQADVVHKGPPLLYGGDAHPETLMPLGGWQQLCEKQAEGLEIRFETVVAAVRAEGDGVVVELSSGEKLPCAACICTLPHGVLKAEKVAFEPPLPAPKLDAIARMSSGFFNRCAIRFDTCFWATNGMVPCSGRCLINMRIPTEMGRDDPTNLQCNWWFDWSLVAKSNIIVLWFFSAVGENVEKLTDAEVIESALKTLEMHFPKEAVRSSKVLEMKMSRWGADPYACGTYASYPAGTNGEIHDHMASPHGSVFFAGEATIKGLSGTVAGAMVSGRRAAKEVCDHMKLGLET